MIAIDGQTLLALWERAAPLSPPRRALALVAAVRPQLDDGALAALSLGQRDAALYDLRTAVFGPRLELVARCPACEETLEVELSLDQPAAPPAPTEQRLCLEHNGYRLSFRPLTAGDLVAVVPGSEVRRALAARCLTAAEHAGSVVAAEAIDEPTLAALAAALAAADPAADARLELCCLACGHAWEADFDIAAVLWEELAAWAARTLREVDTLARAYGWSEAAILALTLVRRRAYLELIIA